MEPKKAPKADLEKIRTYLFEGGLVVALIIVYILINLTVGSGKVENLGQVKAKNIDEDIITITEQQKKPPPPPPPKQKTQQIKIVKNDTKIKNEAKIQSSEADQNTQVQIVQQPQEKAKPEKIFMIVQQMPAMPGCADLPTEEKRKACTTQKMYEHFAKVQQYPEMAKEAGIQGRVYVSFVVNSQGKVDNVTVLRGVPGGKALDDEAVRMVKSLPDFTPGQQRGKNVSVRYNLPINFTLQ